MLYGSIYFFTDSLCLSDGSKPFFVSSCSNTYRLYPEVTFDFLKPHLMPYFHTPLSISPVPPHLSLRLQILKHFFPKFPKTLYIEEPVKVPII